ncbi:UDP-N-acetylmuramoyl-tripeptide--D-alanyl-D-alanine ligase [Tritonibacter multivorans]|uniref:UDP-N-acetylmuramoyl-tripeptide--D-alanyl-D-alanine ligase n=1 Tax=Tritonibacter multivorans TaxID=928856 RepID=A0A0P1GFU5_9RHOB|nr:UDP-N-acetylmuramoyl-tripeptide--D-alanyl-D-alanine ligase [Tritonibacter multivorans]MDA7421056.1 UDP-N-acetylmuramoyl-tripeptide--D-alanyl-D-alanine ligase [Tritonibacter multivorans]CUH80267.1 UDP-N-acetylmuramoyl-tripeptide--D-alanyl-D-alanine ligase [Tritonibacter multivorans]SFC76933.1 UDP-N-acetylmuramoyl-tripeptide--D-alanyl-D-alanine ligase [Tritonibacter multivorans]
MTLWTAKEAEAATGGRAQGDWSVNGISIDTRTIAQGDLFVALKAARDGHDFVAQALEKGAGAALVSRIPEGVADDAPLLIVDDVQTGLEALGAAGRARTDAKVVAVTGSVGKTSTKEMLACMLGDQGRTHAAVASYNNHWGVPLTLARMPQDTEFAVIEVGMNHPGEIAPLARQARPHVAMVTTVAAVHLEAFEDVAGIAREKAAIMEGLEPGGVAVLNADLAETPVLAEEADRMGAITRWFGTTSQDYHLGAVTLTGEETRAEATCAGVSKTLSIQSLGTHFAMNALGALAAVEALGADIDLAIQSLSRWSPVKGRGARLSVAVDGGTITVLDDSYNANPTSVAAALAVLAASPAQGRRIACLGDMGELGEDAAALHAGLATGDAMTHVDAVYSVGPLMQNLHAALPQGHAGKWFETSTDAAEALTHELAAGDILLVKGSNYMQLVRVVDALREMGQGS